jgi:hypothetical protein
MSLPIKVWFLVRICTKQQRKVIFDTIPELQHQYRIELTRSVTRIRAKLDKLSPLSKGLIGKKRSYDTPMTIDEACQARLYTELRHLSEQSEVERMLLYWINETYPIAEPEPAPEPTQKPGRVTSQEYRQWLERRKIEVDKQAARESMHQSVIDGLSN